MKHNQQVFNFSAGAETTVHIHNDGADAGPEQSKDEIIKVRVTPDHLDRIDAFCRGRRITRSDYLRLLLSLDDVFVDHIDTLNQHADGFLVNMLETLSKKF